MASDRYYRRAGWRDQSDGELQDDFVSDGSAITRGFVGDPETIEMRTERITTESRFVGSWHFPTTNNLTDGCLRFSTKRRKLCHKHTGKNLRKSSFICLFAAIATAIRRTSR
jgi:hypothetical protein